MIHVLNRSNLITKQNKKEKNKSDGIKNNKYLTFLSNKLKLSIKKSNPAPHKQTPKLREEDPL
jgi:hypothetical protein